MENQYFKFELDFVEDNMRCIPMIVRYKLDAVGIKLKLSEWSRMNPDERETLASLSVDNDIDIMKYRSYLKELIVMKTGNEPTELTDQNYEWTGVNVPEKLTDKLSAMNLAITAEKWKMLTELQRFSLMKLAQSAHENKNLPKALREFDLV